MDMYFARQPIFNRNKKVIAYEFLYRTAQDSLINWDGDMATSTVINNSSLLMDLSTLTKGKKAFINFTKKLIDDKIPLLYSEDILVIELLEDIIPDPDFIDTIIELKSKGYTIALDDFTPSYPYKELIKLADIIKVDVLSTSKEEREQIANTYKKKDVQLLAEKVETPEEFQHALRHGYTLFQGYFFAKPVIIKGKDIKGNFSNYIRLMEKLAKSEPDFKELTTIIESDLSLTYKILRLVNSPAFFGVTEIHSVHQALVRLGINEIQKLISLLLIGELAKGKPDEIVRLSLIRAKAFELMASVVHQEHRKNDFFLIGIFSLLDVIMQRPMHEVIDELPLSKEVKSALIDKDSEWGTIFSAVTSYEKANWIQFEQLCEKFSMPCNDMPSIYYQSLSWTEEVLATDIEA